MREREREKERERERETERENAHENEEERIIVCYFSSDNIKTVIKLIIILIKSLI